MKSAKFLEKEYLEYLDYKNIISKDKHHHINSFIQGELDIEQEEYTIPEFDSILIRDISQHIQPIIVSKKVTPLDISIYINKNYPTVSFNKPTNSILVSSNKSYIISANEEVVVLGFSLKGFQYNPFIETPNIYLVNGNNYYINYNAEKYFSDLKKVLVNIHIYNYATTKNGDDVIKYIEYLIFKTSEINFKYNKNINLIKVYNDLLLTKITESYGASTYSAFFNSSLQMIYEDIVIYGQEDKKKEYIKKLNYEKSKNEKIIENNNLILKHELKLTTIKNISKNLFPNLFNKNHKDCLFLNDKLFSLNQLPVKYKKLVLLEYERNKKYMEQLNNNKCLHNEMLKEFYKKQTFTNWEKIKEFVPDINIEDSPTTIINCKECSYSLICPHLYQYYSSLFQPKLITENNEPITEDTAYSLMQTITNKYASDLNIEYKYYCNICGEFLMEDTNELDVIRKKVNLLRKITNTVVDIDEEFKKTVIIESFQMVNANVKLLRPDVESKTISYIISDIIMEQLNTINNKINKNKKINEEQQHIIFRFHLRLYILVSLVLIIIKTKSIAFKDYKQTTDIKLLLSHIFHIFIARDKKIISMLNIQHNEIKSLIIEYYKNILNNNIKIFQSDDKPKTNLSEDENLLNNLNSFKLFKFFNRIYQKNKVFPKGAITLPNIQTETINKENYKYNSLLCFLSLNPLNFTKHSEADEKTLNNIADNLLKYQNTKSVFDMSVKLPFSKPNFGVNRKNIVTKVYNELNKNNINSFYQWYLLKCPKSEFHVFEKNKQCTHCLVKKEELESKDVKYYEKYKDTYSVILKQIKDFKQSKLDDIIKNYKQSYHPIKPIEIKLNKENISLISYVFNIDEAYLYKLGSIEDIEYNIKDIKNIEIVDFQDRILKLKNYLLYILIEYKKFCIEHEEVTRISINALDEINKYYQALSEQDMSILILNTVIESLLSIYKINQKDKSIFKFVDQLIKNILKFDELYSKYDYSQIKYLLRKASEPDDVIMQEKNYDEDEEDEQDDIFGSNIFDLAYDGEDGEEDNEDSINEIKTE